MYDRNRKLGALMQQQYSTRNSLHADMHKLLWDQLINMSEQKLTWHTIKSRDPEAFQLELCLGNSKIE